MSKVLNSLPDRRARRHRLLRRSRHLRRRRLDAREGCDPLHLRGRPRSVRRRRHRHHPRARAAVRRGDLPPGRLQGGPGRGGPGRPAVWRVPHPDGRPDLLQHHPAGSRRHRHPARPGDEGRRRRHLGRRVDLQGQRHRALLPVRPAGQPSAADLQAVAGRELRRRARRPGGDVGLAGRARPARTGRRRRRPTAPTPTSGAPPTRPSGSSTSTPGWRSSSRSWASPTGATTSRSHPRSSR